MPDYTRSPFPGMDPWMEFRWGDVHRTLAGEARNALNRSLPPGLYASTEDRIVLDPAAGAAGKPDAYITEMPPGAADRDAGTGGGANDADGGTAVLTAPVRIRVVMEPLTEPTVVIRDANGDRLVAAIEWVSPTNKIDVRAADEFRAKRLRVLNGGAHSVEVDLTRIGRAGPRRRLFSPGELPASLDTDYAAVVFRADRLLEADAYAMPLRSRLPTIAVPLRAGDDDLPLDLQPLVDVTWRTGRYWTLDYSRPLDPPLSPADASWAAGRVSAWREGRPSTGEAS